jgi:hypothetical protein
MRKEAELNGYYRQVVEPKLISLEPTHHHRLIVHPFGLLLSSPSRQLMYQMQSCGYLS